MSNPHQKSNIDYIQLCKALEEGDKVSAQNLLLNSGNVNNSIISVVFNLALGMFEALTSMEIIKSKLYTIKDGSHNFNAEDSHLCHFCKKANTVLQFSNKSFESIKEIKQRIAANNVNVNNFIINDSRKFVDITSDILDMTIRLLNSGVFSFIEKHHNYQIINRAIQDDNTLGACLFINRVTLVEEELNVLLLEAIKCKNDTIFEMLIDKGLSLDYKINTQDISLNGDTLLHKAIENDFKVEIIQTLLKLNSSVDAVNHNMLTPLLVACKIKLVNQLKIVEALLDYNANVNCTDCNGMTPLHFACQGQSLEVIAILLEKGANLNATNNRGQTSLHVLFDSEDGFSNFDIDQEQIDIIVNIIELLLQHNANLEAVDTNGRTPLFLACETDQLKIVKCILDRGANVNHTDLENQTPLYVTTLTCYFAIGEIIKLLLEHKANVYHINKLGQSIIHVISKRNASSYPEHIFKRLVDTTINFNSIDKEGNTPLHIAVEEKSEIMIKSLIKYGANINKQDKKNRTPLQKAIEYVSENRKNLENRDFIRRWFEVEWGNTLNNDDPDVPYMSYKREYVYPYEKVVRLIKMHIVKLKTAGLNVSKQNLNLFYNSENNVVSDNEFTDEDVPDTEDSKTDILQIETRCEREIEKMKMESIGVSYRTFYDLLTKNIHRLVKNGNIHKILNQNEYTRKFPLYIHIVRARLRDAKFRYEIRNLAEKYFSVNICRRLPDDCIDAIFNYLNFKDINTFIKAMKPLDGLDE